MNKDHPITTNQKRYTVSYTVYHKQGTGIWFAFEHWSYFSESDDFILSPECTSGLSARAATGQKDLLVINFDLEPECPDVELRATLQWIAASELGIPVIYFKKSQENRIEKVCLAISEDVMVLCFLRHIDILCIRKCSSLDVLLCATGRSMTIAHLMYIEKR